MTTGGRPEETLADQFGAVTRAVRRRWWVVGATAVLTTAASLGVTATSETVWETGTEALLTQRAAEALFTPARTTDVATEVELARSGAVRELAEDRLGRDLPLGPPELSVGLVPDTAVLRVASQDTDADRATETAKTYMAAYIDERRRQSTADLERARRDVLDKSARLDAQIAVTRRSSDGRLTQDDLQALEAAAAASGNDAFRREIQALSLAGGLTREGTDIGLVGLLLREAQLRQRADDIELAATLVEDGGPQIITAAGSRLVVVSPQPVKNALLGLVSGLLLGMALAVAADRLDRRVRREQTPEGRPLVAGHEVVAVVPPGAPQLPGLAPARPTADAGRHAGHYAVAASRLVRTDPGAVVLVVAADRSGDGVDAAASLADASARSGRRTALALCDTSGILGFDGSAGWTDVASGRLDLDAALRHGRSAAVLMPGRETTDQVDAAGGAGARKVLSALRAGHDLVVVAVPAVGATTDAQLLAPAVDHVVLVVEELATSLPEAARALQHLHDAGSSPRVLLIEHGRSRPSSRGPAAAPAPLDAVGAR